jgi:hypothetical protein
MEHTFYGDIFIQKSYTFEIIKQKRVNVSEFYLVLSFLNCFLILLAITVTHFHCILCDVKGYSTEGRREFYVCLFSCFRRLSQF